jgi:hypothetical protein
MPAEMWAFFISLERIPIAWFSYFALFASARHPLPSRLRFSVCNSMKQKPLGFQINEV